MAKEAKKETVKETVKFIHKDNPYFIFTSKRITCQFRKSVYETSNEKEIEALTEYMYNTNDLMISR